MITKKLKRRVIPLQAKILTSANKQHRYVVARFYRDTSQGYSYHYFLIGARDQLRKELNTKAIAKFLAIEGATREQIYSFADAIWDGTVVEREVKRLQADIGARRKAK